MQLTWSFDSELVFNEMILTIHCTGNRDTITAIRPWVLTLRNCIICKVLRCESLACVQQDYRKIRGLNLYSVPPVVLHIVIEVSYSAPLFVRVTVAVKLLTSSELSDVLDVALNGALKNVIQQI